MTEKLYYKDTYLKETLCTVISAVRKEKCTEVVTDKTVFYPECGGQPGDRGTLGDFRILDTRKADNGDSVLILEADVPVTEGLSCNQELDWDFRYKYMKMHTAQHLLSGLLFSQFGIGTVAVHLGDDYLSIEVDTDKIPDKVIENLIKIANLRISEAHRIIYREMSHAEAEALNMRRSIKVDGDVRIVEIEDIDRIACGGVHVAKTSELSLVLYSGCEQIRGHVRLFFKTGLDALNLVYGNQKLVTSLRDGFSCSDEEVLPKVQNLIAENSSLKRSVSELSVKSAKVEIDGHCEKGVAVFESELDLSAFGQALENYDELALFVYDSKRWLIGLKGKFAQVDFNRIRAEVFAVAGAKGGGRPPMYQGIYTQRDKISEFVSVFRKATDLSGKQF